MCGLAPSAEPHVQQFRPLCSLLCSKGVPGTAVRQPVKELWPTPGTCQGWTPSVLLEMQYLSSLRMPTQESRAICGSGCRESGLWGLRESFFAFPTPSRLRLLHKQQMRFRHLASHLLSLLLSSETQPDCLSKQTVNSTIRPF